MEIVKKMLPIILALVVYDLVIKGLLAKVNLYDDTFDGTDHFDK